MRILIGGPDGAGKSTIANLLSEQLTTAGAIVERMHYRPNYLFTKVTSPAADHSNPHALGHHGFIQSAAKLMATFADTLSFHLVSVRRGCSRRVIIQERGWWDQAIDRQRYRLHPKSSLLVKSLGHCLPRPQLVVVLTGPPALIHSRKPELSVREIARQTAAWTQAAPHIGRSHINLDMRESPEAATQRILKVLESS